MTEAEERIAWLRSKGVLIEFPEDRAKKAATSKDTYRNVIVVKIPHDEKIEFSEAR